MTLKVTIGLVEIEEEENSFVLLVKSCPSAQEDICDRKFTKWPRESFRSGPSSFYQFFTKNVILEEMIENGMDRSGNPLPLIRYINAINEIDITQFETEVDKDRFTFLKYWANEAMNLYGNRASIQFK